MSFVRAANPIWYLPDLVGEPLNDEYYAFFLTNTLPYLPQNVYRDNQGQTVWTGNVVQFAPNGTLPNNLYFDPNLVYRIEIRHGDSQSDPLIYEINDFVPGDDTSVVTDLSILDESNQATNPQFSNVNFTRAPGQSTVTTTMSAAGSYLIAPGWFLDLVGSGSATVQQIIYSADQNTSSPFNPVPPYALRVNTSGSWSTVTLRQRFRRNGGIYANGAISMSVLALAEDTPHTITLKYRPQTPGSPVTVKQGVISTGAFQTLAGVKNIGNVANTNFNNVSYVDMEIDLPTTGIMQFSNFQVVGQITPVQNESLAPIPSFKQESEERETDHLFHYYANDILIKPKKSVLVGWNFPLNPYQFIDPTIATVAAETSYVADQTILHQEAASQLQTGRNTDAQRGNFVVKAVTAATATRFAIIQYIDARSIRPYWSYKMSCLVRARIASPTNTTVGLKVKLLYRTDIPPLLSATEPIASWAAASDPTFAAGWTALTPLNDPEYILQNAYATDETAGANAYPSYAFDEFNLPNASTANMTLAIVVYTMDNLHSVAASEDSVEFDKISLIPSHFAADADPQSFDECLRECQYYYEKSYNVGDVLGTVTREGVRYVRQQDNFANPILGYVAPFAFDFYTIKRATDSIMEFYSPTAGTANRVDFNLVNNGGTPDVNVINYTNHFPQTKFVGEKGYYSNFGTNTTIGSVAQAPVGQTPYLLFHYTADARLGVLV